MSKCHTCNGTGAIESEVWTFGELAEGDAFIFTPIDGDNSGHGGFRAGSYLFVKTSGRNARRNHDHNISTFPATMRVLKKVHT